MRSDEKMQKPHQMQIPTWQITLAAIDNKEMYKSEIAKETDNTYSHIVNVCKSLHKKGLTKETKEGRKQIITLTEKGKETAQAIKIIIPLADKIKKIPYDHKI
jgi:predicted transcriptional regulator